MARNKQETEEAARVCVCGHNPVTVKSGKRYMLACPDVTRCALRSVWATNEQAAIKSWNLVVEEAINRGKGKTAD